MWRFSPVIFLFALTACASGPARDFITDQEIRTQQIDNGRFCAGGSRGSSSGMTGQAGLNARDTDGDTTVTQTLSVTKPISCPHH